MAKAMQRRATEVTATYEPWLLTGGKWVWKDRAQENMVDLLTELRAASWAKTIDQNW